MQLLPIVAVGLPLAATLAAVITLVVVLWGASDRRLAITMGVFASFIGAWNLLVGLQAIPGAVTQIPGFLDFLRYPFIFLPAVALQTVVLWSGRRIRFLPAMAMVGYGLAGIFAVMHWRGLLFEGWVSYEWGAFGKPGPLYALLVAFMSTWLVAMGGMAVAYFWIPCDPSTRLRMRYLAVASLAGVPLGLMNFLPNYGVDIPPLGGLGSILVLAVLGYGALRHRMLDIDVVVLKAAGSAFAATVLLVPSLVAITLLQRSILGAAHPLITIAFGGAMLIALACYSRARDAVATVIERSLFPARHDARRAIETLSREVVELAHRDHLGPQLTSTLGSGLGLLGVALYVRASDADYQLDASWGQIYTPTPLPCMPTGSSDASGTWELCLPIGSNGYNQGFIAFGPKRSGAAIDDLDLTLLRVVASQVAVALRNLDYVRELEGQRDALEHQRVAIAERSDEIQRQKAEIEELQKRIVAENTVLRAEVRTVSGFGEIVGASAALQRVLALVEKAAPSDASVLVTGETGTGKELIARALHERSERRAGPLINVNCPAIPRDLAEVELFGCERGAFTGADEARPGRFELAEGGTIFLDEVADLPHAIQTKLLRVLQEREVQRLGSARVRRIDVRVVAATNRDLDLAMARGEFRPDLFYRLATIRTHLPPLRERLDDVEMLATYFLDRAAKANQKPISALSAGAVRALCSYNWPGNIRELQNVIERAVLLCDGEVVTPHHLGDLGDNAPEEEISLRSVVRDEKARRVEDALRLSGGNIARAAEALGLSPSNLSRLMKRLDISRSRFVQ